MEKLFEQLNLTKGEIKVYTSLIKTGGSTMTEVSCKTKLKRSTVQLYVSSLLDKGFVVASKIRGRFYYQSEDPDKIRQIINERLFIVDKFIESLNISSNKHDKWQVSCLNKLDLTKNSKKLTFAYSYPKKQPLAKIHINNDSILISSKDKQLPYLQINSAQIADFHRIILG